ncbi:MAG: polysaccharide deacetylase family protein [bacterium]
MKNRPPFMLTVDVEPDWGISGNECILQTLPRFCEMLRRLQMPATFFVVANLLESCGALLKHELADYEVGSHGLTHRVLTELPQEEVIRELVESRRKLEAFFGKPVTGFRAPFLKTPPGWFQLLEQAGYRYDSSLGAVAPSLKNQGPDSWRLKKIGTIVEIPITSLRTGLIPLSLTYLRLLAPVGEKLVSPESAIMFLHLHELADPGKAALLPWRLRYILRRNAGETAWDILERTLSQFATRGRTCGDVVSR